MNNDLISREALKKVIWDESHIITTISECGTEVACYGLTINEIEQIIDNAPTVDTYTENDVQYAIKEGHQVGYEMAKAKYERPQGEWLDIYSSHIAYKCSCCERQMPILDYYHFCPNCGAKMKEEAENE